MFITSFKPWRVVYAAHVSFFICLISSVATAAPESSGAVKYITNLPAVDCVINPYQVIDLASPVRGVIDKLHVNRSDPVVRGQMVAELASGVEKSTVELAKRRASIKSEIKVGEIALAFDGRRKTRYEKLYDEKAVSAENVDEASKEHELSVWKLQQAKEQLDVRNLELNRAHEQLQQKTIRSPINGYVLDTFKHSGEFVEEQPIMRIAQLDPLIIEAIMPMENYGQIKVGMQAEIQPEVLSSGRRTGVVTVVDRIGDTASGTFGVRLEMSNPDSSLPAGLKCVAKFMEGMAKPIVKTVAAAPVQEKTIEAKPVEEKSVEAKLVEQKPAQVEADSSMETDYESTKPVYVASIAAVKTEQRREGSAYISDEDLDQMRHAKTIFVTPLKQRDKNIKGYVVLIPQPADNLQKRKLVGHLHNLGVTEVLEMDHGRYRGFISLGIYNGPIGAEKRRKAIADLDIFSILGESEIDGVDRFTEQDLPDNNRFVEAVDNNQFAVVKNEQASIASYISDEDLDQMRHARTIFVTPLKQRDKDISGYIVLIPQPADNLEKRKLVSHLRELGVTEVLEMDHGRYRGFISLGIYNGPKTADKRRREVKNLDIFASLDER